MNCPACKAELEAIGTADFGLNQGAWLKCQACGSEWLSTDSDGTLTEYKPLPLPRVRMDDIKGWRNP